MATAIPTNHASFTLDELRVATSARGFAVRGTTTRTTSVVTDSRAVVPGCVFVALRGARFDGHDHAREALEKGAACVIVSRELGAGADHPPGSPSAPTGSVLLVDDTTRALGDLASFHRRRWIAQAKGQSRLVVGITGSAGKTTTRKAVAALLDRVGLVHATTGNLNNLIGMPMVLLGLEESHEVCVVEIGTSAPGEIARLAEIASPDVGVLTLVAAAHTEGLGTIDKVADEKGALLLAAREVAIVNGDDDRAAAQLARTNAREWITYGRGRHTLRVVREVTTAEHGTELTITGDLTAGEEIVVKTPLLGKAGVFATLAAVATLGALTEDAITQDILDGAFDGLADDDDQGRLRLLTTGSGALILDDAYNANGASMAAGLETAAAIARREQRSLVLVLGEMGELGDLAASEHDAVAEAAVAQAPRLVVAVRGEARRYADLAQKSGLLSQLVDDAEGAIAVLARELRPTDLVFVKGSRSVGLERVVRALGGDRQDA